MPVTGTSEAIGGLTRAVSHDSLFIQSTSAPTPEGNVKIAYQHLQQQGLFPLVEQLGELHSPTMQGGLAPGLEPEDWDLRRVPAPQSSPPFQTLDVCQVLGTLRIVAKFYDGLMASSGYAASLPQNAYQLGIITQTMRLDGTPWFTAEVFQSRPEVQTTGTLWLHRRCTANGRGGYDEHWRALGDRTFDSNTLAELPPLLAASFPDVPPVAAASRKRIRGMTEEAENATAPQSAELSQRAIKRTRHEQPAVPDEQLFEHDPDSIRGEAILRFARHYGNTELFERVNKGLAAKGMTELRSANVITRRITCAIQGRTGNDKEAAKRVRKELNEARRVNGVKERVNATTMETKEKNRAEKERQARGSGGS